MNDGRPIGTYGQVVLVLAMRAEWMSVTELHETITVDVTRQAVSNALRHLHDEGLVLRQTEGKTALYHLADESGHKYDPLRHYTNEELLNELDKRMVEP